MPRRPRLVGLLWRWHRRLGLLAALFALVLALSGIVLNHSAELGLDRSVVDSPFVHGFYGDHSADLPAYQLGEQWLYRSPGGRVYLDEREVAACNGELMGAVAAQGLLVLACKEEILLLTGSGQLVEAAGASTGLELPVTGIGSADAGVVVHAGGAWRLADLERMAFDESVPGGTAIRQLTPDALPADLRRAIPGQHDWLNWERLLLDLHSGRLFGRGGVWVVDAIGVLLIGLACSGVAMWWLHRRRGRRQPG